MFSVAYKYMNSLVSALPQTHLQIVEDRNSYRVKSDRDGFREM